MSIIGIILNIIGIVVLGDYGLFADGVDVHEDSAIYEGAYAVMNFIGSNK